MSSGLSGIREAAKERDARRAAGGGGGDRIQWLKLQDGESATVRFLEQGDDVAWSYAHQADPVGNQKYGDWVPCLNTNNDGTPCPGCEAAKPRKVRGYINLIWKDGPLFEREDFKRDDGSTGQRLKRDSEGNILVTGRGPILAVWAAGIQVFEELDGLDSTYKGLMSRDFQIKRKGTMLATTYSIYPMDAEPMTDAEKKLAEGKTDLKQFTVPPAYENWGKGGDGGGNGQQQSSQESVNPFLSTRDN